jgi:hypothetical protein
MRRALTRSGTAIAAAAAPIRRTGLARSSVLSTSVHARLLTTGSAASTSSVGSARVGRASSLPADDGLTFDDFVTGAHKVPIPTLPAQRLPAHATEEAALAEEAAITEQMAVGVGVLPALPDNLPNQGSKVPKPAWLKAELPTSDNYHRLKATVKGLGLATVCEEAKCPNIGECWGGKEGTGTQRRGRGRQPREDANAVSGAE